MPGERTITTAWMNNRKTNQYENIYLHKVCRSVLGILSCCGRYEERECEHNQHNSLTKSSQNRSCNFLSVIYRRTPLLISKELRCLFYYRSNQCSLFPTKLLICTYVATHRIVVISIRKDCRQSSLLLLLQYLWIGMLVLVINILQMNHMDQSSW